MNLRKDLQQSNLPEFNKPDRYTGPDGEYYTEKPENMTSLRGTELVSKTHPVIQLRGQLDLLQAEVLQAQYQLRQHKPVADGLGEVLDCLRQVMRAEVLQQPVEDFSLLGLDEAGLREHSHHPLRYYGANHFVPGIQDGPVILTLNCLRARTRQVEISACEAIGSCGQQDIIRVLNRLSSALYILMIRQRAAEC